MNHFRSTGTSGGLLFTRATSAYVRDRASEMLQAAALADAAVTNETSNTPVLVVEVAARVLAVVGASWSAATEDECVRRLASIVSGAEPPPLETAGFDRLCSDVLRLRFPAETARETATPAWGMPRG